MALLASDHGASAVTHDGELYAPIDGAESVFDLPDHVAAALLPFQGWRDATDDDLPDDDGDDDSGDGEAEAPAKPKTRTRRRKTS